jgi:hypothetical protein
MGGWGSGRRIGAKGTTDDYRALDVRRWQRDNLLAPGRRFESYWTRNGERIATINVRVEVGQITLSYRYRSGSDEWKDMEYPLRLDWTPCNYGGQRAWFLCPAAGCGRRVAILYGGAIFACRHCYQLAYTSQRESDGDRALHRAQTIRKKLGGSANMLEPLPWKPKGMHWRTYWRLRAQAEGFANQYMLETMQRFKLLEQRTSNLLERLR